MHLGRVLIVVGQRRQQSRSYVAYDLRHTEESLKSSGMVDNIDILYYSDYASHCDDILINYCLQSKPEAVLLSVQNIGLVGPSFMAVRKEGVPTPNCLGKITHQLHIPTVAFWGDIHSDSIVEVLERYHDSVTLNVLWGADASSHRPLMPEVTNYIYTGVTFDEHLFDIPEGLRDIPVGFHGSLSRNRAQWIDGLRSLGISVYTGNGEQKKDTPVWVPYEEYYQYMSRLKVMIDFSSLVTKPEHLSEQVFQAFRRCAVALKFIGSSWKNPVPAVKDTISELRASGETKYQTRSRAWEALWLRTFLLGEDNPVTNVYFEPYVDYVPFTTLDDLADKIKYYLANEVERDRIRMHGHATVKKYYNAKMYWENLFESVGIESGGRCCYDCGEVWNKEYLGQLMDLELLASLDNPHREKE